MNYLLFFGILALIVFFTADIFTTDLGLNSGGIEGNPIMKNVVSSLIFHGVVKGLALVCIVIGIKYAEKKIRGSGILGLYVCLGLYTLIIINNLSVLLGV